MRKLTWLFLVTTSIVVVTSGCGQRPPAVSSPQPPTPTSVSPTAVPSPTLTPPPPSQDGFEIVIRTNFQDDSKTDVYIKNSETGEEELFITLGDVYREHYHNSEYHNGNLYIIRRIGYAGSLDEEWSDELWKYDVQGVGTQIHSARGLDFRAAPNERYVAVAYSLDGSADPSEGRLAFLDSQGDLAQEFTADQLGGPYSHSVSKWSDDSSEFWGMLHVGPSPQVFYRIEPASWQVNTYDVSQLSVPAEYDLNANIGRLAYSDYPAMFDMESVGEFEESQQQVTLFVYDFSSQSTQTIATSMAKPFNPIWLDDSTIECDDPDGEGRIAYPVD